MPLTNKFPATEENNLKKKISLKLCSPQTWYILPNSENTQSRRLSLNHILTQHPWSSKTICAIDPKSFDQVLYPKDVLVVLKEIWKSQLTSAAQVLSATAVDIAKEEESQGVWTTCPGVVSCSQQVLHSLLQASKHLVLRAWPLTAPLPNPGMGIPGLCWFAAIKWQQRSSQSPNIRKF